MEESFGVTPDFLALDLRCGRASSWDPKTAVFDHRWSGPQGADPRTETKGADPRTGTLKGETCFCLGVPAPFLSWRLACGLVLRALFPCPVFPGIRARGPWVPFGGFRFVPGPGRLLVVWWATALVQILSSSFVEVAVRGDMRFEQVHPFTPAWYFWALLPPFSGVPSTLCSWTTRRILSRHCTVRWDVSSHAFTNLYLLNVHITRVLAQPDVWR